MGTRLLCSALAFVAPGPLGGAPGSSPAVRTPSASLGVIHSQHLYFHTQGYKLPPQLHFKTYALVNKTFASVKELSLTSELLSRGKVRGLRVRPLHPKLHPEESLFISDGGWQWDLYVLKIKQGNIRGYYI